MVAISVTGTNVSPIPIDIGSRPGSSVPRYVPSTDAWASMNRPPAAITMPSIVVSRTPSFFTRICDSPEPITMPAVTGRNARPASSGL